MRTIHLLLSLALHDLEGGLIVVIILCWITTDKGAYPALLTVSTMIVPWNTDKNKSCLLTFLGPTTHFPLCVSSLVETMLHSHALITQPSRSFRSH
jgi:hypothetical protein